MEQNKTNLHVKDTRIDGKPTVREIVAASQSEYSSIKYEIIVCKGVEILIRRSAMEVAIKTTVEFTHDPAVIELAKELGIKLRKFR